MRILISNDDGYLAPGISALAKALEPIAEVAVVAPDSNRSGASSSLTLERPISVYEGKNGFLYTTGTPSDCVHIAVTGVLPVAPRSCRRRNGWWAERWERHTMVDPGTGLRRQWKDYVFDIPFPLPLHRSELQGWAELEECVP